MDLKHSAWAVVAKVANIVLLHVGRKDGWVLVVVFSGLVFGLLPMPFAARVSSLEDVGRRRRPEVTESQHDLATALWISAKIVDPERRTTALQGLLQWPANDPEGGYTQKTPATGIN